MINHKIRARKNCGRVNKTDAPRFQVYLQGKTAEYACAIIYINTHARFLCGIGTAHSKRVEKTVCLKGLNDW